MPAAPRLADPAAAGRDALHVETPQNAAPIIRLPVERTEIVSRTLTEAGVRHWVQNPYPSLSGGWERKILLTYAADVAAVQEVLDGLGAE